MLRTDKYINLLRYQYGTDCADIWLHGMLNGGFVGRLLVIDFRSMFSMFMSLMACTI